MFYDSYDVNSAVSNDASSTKQHYKMSLPDMKLYKDVYYGMNIPEVTTTKIEAYLQQFDCHFEKKVEIMYTERYLRYLRLYPETKGTYIHGCIWAEMRKSVSYPADILFDKFGMVVEAQCECGAGSGPTAHCKHIQLCLHSLRQMRIDKSVITEQTCTQVLQTFHRTKPYKGSPMKTATFQEVRIHNLSYDPRPAKFRKRLDTDDRMRNACISYQATHPAVTALDKMPVLQLYNPANYYALYQDHDYFPLSMEDYFLKKEKVTKITREDIARIEKETRNQSTSSSWFQHRRLRITASRTGEIVKATDRKNMKLLASSICNPSSFSSAATRHGIKYEPVAIELYEKTKNVKVEKMGLVISSIKPYIAASPDGVVVTQGKQSLIEVKCPYSIREQSISCKTLPWLKSDENGNEILDQNHNYYYQIQTQLFCTGADNCTLVIFTLKGTKFLDVPRDEEKIKMMIEKLDTFFVDHFRAELLDTFLYRKYYSYSF